jgi:hypothetical protein
MYHQPSLPQPSHCPLVAIVTGHMQHNTEWGTIEKDLQYAFGAGQLT